MRCIILHKLCLLQIATHCILSRDAQDINSLWIRYTSEVFRDIVNPLELYKQIASSHKVHSLWGDMAA